MHPYLNKETSLNKATDNFLSISTSVLVAFLKKMNLFFWSSANISMIQQLRAVFFFLSFLVIQFDLVTQGYLIPLQVSENLLVVFSGAKSNLLAFILESCVHLLLQSAHRLKVSLRLHRYKQLRYMTQIKTGLRGTFWIVMFPSSTTNDDCLMSQFSFVLNQ